jgi:NifU-like protein involved in Fe-S cluster formation
MNEPLYTVEILRLAASIPHLGRLDGAQGRSELRSPTCGSTVAVDVVLDDDGRVSALGLQVEACAFGQASAALMGADAIGREMSEIEQALAEFSSWLHGLRADPGRWGGLDVLQPAQSRSARHGAMLLPFRALLAAVDEAARNSPAASSMADGR